MGRPRGQDTDDILYDLCVELGFCLRPEDHQRLVTSPPTSVDEFVVAVFNAEGLGPPNPNTAIYASVRRLVERRWKPAP